MMIRTFFTTSIPDSLYEAAEIDGASQMKIFTSIVIPLGKPILVTMGTFAGLTYWNDWTNGLYYLVRNKKSVQYTESFEPDGYQYPVSGQQQQFQCGVGGIGYSVNGYSDGNCVCGDITDYADFPFLPEVLFQGAYSWRREGLTGQSCQCV